MTASPTDDSGRADAGASGDEPTVVAGSTIVAASRAAGRRVAAWVRGSAIYEWLTAEPDPDVIVIDLRETWTVGPFLVVLDRVIDALVAAASGSRLVEVGLAGVDAVRAAPLRVGGLAAAVIGLLVAVRGVLGGPAIAPLALGVAVVAGGLVAMRDDRDWETLRETRPVELALAALEPPEPPESTEGTEPAGEGVDGGAETADGRTTPETEANHSSTADDDEDDRAGSSRSLFTDDTLGLSVDEDDDDET